MILFISTHTGNSWGGSEQLWTRTAALLARQGLAVSASVHGWHHLDPHVIDLLRAGVDVRSRPIKPSFIDKLRRHISARTQIVVDIERSFANVTPSLVVISNGADFPPIELAEWCVEKGWPFVTLANAISSDWWHTDEMAARWRAVLPLARRCLFVSKQNRALAERQLGFDFDNAEIVLNPVLVDTTLRIPWPAFENQLLRMACVSRLDIAQKGQDILLEAIAGPRWSKREWHVTFYGKGPNQDSIERLARRLKIRDRIDFGGHTAIETIWRENHILVMPSRYEGGPMTTVEAMWYARPVVATNVGLNSEVIDDGTTGFLAEAAAAPLFDKALERMWAHRDKLEEIGKLAAISIRKFVPNDPVRIFSDKLKTLAS